ncbi:hypothetical protein [Maricaulis sp.]|uniref:hypothetical protein n=1 Tax=Maricaulis sp. TaxID=1486257 RepID=UPI002B277109|nr:hypothetical protein [Maricaulis sp.]
MSDVVFTVAETSVWEVFQWRWIPVFYVVSAAFIAFPRLLDFWPLSNFAFFEKRKRLNGVLLSGLVTLMGGGHFLMTYLPLKSSQASLQAGQCAIVVASFDGRKPDQELMTVSVAETTLTFEGADYEMPGSLYGSVYLLPVIRANLEAGRSYSLCVLDDVILRIEHAPVAGAPSP